MTTPRPSSTPVDPPGGPGSVRSRFDVRPSGADTAASLADSGQRADEISLDIEADDAPIGERALSKLRWRCRRGLLENDLFIERFFARHAAALTERQARGLLALMDLSDNDLLDLLLSRKQPDSPTVAPGAALDDDAVQVLRLMRAPA